MPKKTQFDYVANSIREELQRDPKPPRKTDLSLAYQTAAERVKQTQTKRTK